MNDIRKPVITRKGEWPGVIYPCFMDLCYPYITNKSAKEAASQCVVKQRTNYGECVIRGRNPCLLLNEKTKHHHDKKPV